MSPSPPRPPETFETARLVLSKPSVSDAEALFEEYCQDPQVTRYLIWRPHQTIAETNAFLESCGRNWEAATEFSWVIRERSQARVMGMVAVGRKAGTIELGYVLSQSAWGQGYMVEAILPIIRWWLDDPSIFRMQAFCDTENLASARVLEKSGFTHEGLIRRCVVHPNLSPEPRDCFLYVIVRP